MTMKSVFFIITTIIVSFQQVCLADDSPASISFGASLMPSTWDGSNQPGSNYKQKATQLALNLRVRKGNFYTGLSFQGGEFDFGDEAPDIVGENISLPVSDVTVKRGESDLVFGYFFWPQVSLFVDFKHIHNKWQDRSYANTAKGMGIGVSGFNPINDQWILFGSLGFIKLDVESDDKSIGDGKGSALVIGFLYRLNEQVNFSIGLKSQHNELDFDSGSEQENDIGGLVLGISYTL